MDIDFCKKAVWCAALEEGRVWSLMWNSNGWCKSLSLLGTSYLGQYLGTSEPHVKVDWNNVMESQRAILCLVAFWFHDS